MGNKIKVQLTQQQTNFLVKLPENGMGYHIVDIMLNNGKILTERVVLNSTYLQIDSDEEIDPKDIVRIRQHGL